MRRGMVAMMVVGMAGAAGAQTTALNPLPGFSKALCDNYVKLDASQRRKVAKPELVKAFPTLKGGALSAAIRCGYRLVEEVEPETYRSCLRNPDADTLAAWQGDVAVGLLICGPESVPAPLPPAMSIR